MKQTHSHKIKTKYYINNFCTYEVKNYNCELLWNVDEKAVNEKLQDVATATRRAIAQSYIFTVIKKR